MAEQITLIETTMDMFDDYFKMKCDKTDMYWNGYASPPNEENLKKTVICTVLRSGRYKNIFYTFTGPREKYWVYAA